MLIYDKAVGNAIHETLWALTIGMGLALALELCTARLVGYPINERKLLAYVATNSLRAATAVPLRYRTAWLGSAVRTAMCNARIGEMARTLVAALSATGSDRTS
jgi:ABC-type bacteriocin/lantibiotic exporter with double-glycine peptidase domain